MALVHVLWDLTLGAWKSQLSICGGPVCSFEAFQFGTRRAISAPELEDPDWEVVHPLRGIGGLHYGGKVSLAVAPNLAGASGSHIVTRSLAKVYCGDEAHSRDIFL
jgi:hypothetical protein